MSESTPLASGKSVSNFVSISQALNGHNNSLGIIRLILASLVIVDHAFPLGGFGKDPFWALTRGQASLGSLAVAGFFAVSGYLIAKSGMSGDVVQFMWRRTIRIFPAYWLVLLVTAFLVAPMIWVAGGQQLLDYFSFAPNGPVYYFTANWTLSIGTYGIYDLLAATTPYGREVGASAFNGSLWTLIYEWRAYLIIAALVAFGLLTRARIIVPMLAIFFFILQLLAALNWDIVVALVPTFMADQYMITLGFTFLVGSVFAVYSKQVVFDDRLGIFTGLLALATLRFGGFSTMGTIAAVYFILYLAARLPKSFQWIGQKNDYSYGVYIYGFLVQQVLAFMGVYQWGFFPYVILSWIVTMGCAWLSWHILEKHALSLKDWGPGRGVRFWYERIRNGKK
ncbi:O-antigen acetylase [Aurantimicrobium sp. INA4]|uniref:acyltransferase family protein n=1 Tax=Aurantimicrobium sp. INA4 TaxID=2986279 RepID=UPI00248F767E|nr:acyltransferase [Aurantimicrobium sp. INA4]BDU11253.1 O-antigen acetylase [Aurantimicrobium sp. INA4]